MQEKNGSWRVDLTSDDQNGDVDNGKSWLPLGEVDEDSVVKAYRTAMGADKRLTVAAFNAGEQLNAWREHMRANKAAWSALSAKEQKRHPEMQPTISWCDWQEKKHKMNRGSVQRYIDVYTHKTVNGDINALGDRTIDEILHGWKSDNRSGEWWSDPLCEGDCMVVDRDDDGAYLPLRDAVDEGKGGTVVAPDTWLRVTEVLPLGGGYKAEVLNGRHKGKLVRVGDNMLALRLPTTNEVMAKAEQPQLTSGVGEATVGASDAPTGGKGGKVSSNGKTNSSNSTPKETPAAYHARLVDEILSDLDGATARLKLLTSKLNPDETKAIHQKLVEIDKAFLSKQMRRTKSKGKAASATIAMTA